MRGVAASEVPALGGRSPIFPRRYPALDGWEQVYPLELNAEEVATLMMAIEAIAAANAAGTR